MVVEMKKLLFIFGTRPEFIKVYPVIQEAKRQGNPIVLVNTGQHKEMLNELLDEFSVEVDYDLKIMEKYSGLSEIVAGSISGLDPIIKKEQPDVILVHGDTAATLAGSLVAYFNQIKLAHIEAGLRTYNKFSPFPEELIQNLIIITLKKLIVPLIMMINLPVYNQKFVLQIYLKMLLRISNFLKLSMLHSLFEV